MATFPTLAAAGRDRAAPGPSISPDLPELRTLAQLAAVAPSRLAAAFSDPAHIYEHITLEELDRFSAASERLADLSLELAARLEVAKGAH